MGLQTERCSCGKLLAYKDEWRGKLIRCPACKSVKRAGDMQTMVAEPAPAAAPQPQAAPKPPQTMMEDDEGSLSLDLSAVHKPAPAPAMPELTEMPAMSAEKAKEAKKKKIRTPKFYEVDFKKGLLTAFYFPVTGDGFLVWGTGVFLLILMHFVAILADKFPLLGLSLLGVVALGLYIAGLLIGYLFKVVVTSARGEAVAPNMPEIGVQDILQNVQLLLPYVIFFVATFVIGELVKGQTIQAKQVAFMDNQVLKLALLGIGALSFPMCVLSVALIEDIAGLNPVRIIHGMAVTPIKCLIVSAIVFGAGAAYYYVIPMLYAEKIKWIQYAAPFVLPIIEVYCVIWIGRIIGIIYASSRSKLKFLEE